MRHLAGIRETCKPAELATITLQRCHKAATTRGRTQEIMQENLFATQILHAGPFISFDFQCVRKSVSIGRLHQTINLSDSFILCIPFVWPGLRAHINAALHCALFAAVAVHSAVAALICSRALDPKS